MRLIVKGQSPIELENWKSSFEGSGFVPVYNDLPNPEKQCVRVNLLKEQYYICCYCGKAIKESTCHIEHFRPKSKPEYEALQLDYKNLHASCMGENFKESNCGPKKGDWFDESLTISPLSTDCEEYFSYNANGNINARNDSIKAQETIHNLGLNNSYLQRARKAAIMESGLFDENFDGKRRDELVKFYMTPIDGKLLSFCTAMIYCLMS